MHYARSSRFQDLWTYRTDGSVLVQVALDVLVSKDFSLRFHRSDLGRIRLHSRDLLERLLGPRPGSKHILQKDVRLLQILKWLAEFFVN